MARSVNAARPGSVPVPTRQAPAEQQARRDEERMPAAASEATEEQVGSDLALGIQIPIGAIIALFGLIMVVTGVFGHPQLQRSLGSNVDLWWGAFMIALGLALAFKGVTDVMTRCKVSLGRLLGRG